MCFRHQQDVSGGTPCCRVLDAINSHRLKNARKETPSRAEKYNEILSG